MLKIRKLNCGLRMVLDYIPEMQSVTVGMWVNAGCVDETPENSGISHFIEHMMFKLLRSWMPLVPSRMRLQPRRIPATISNP